MFPMLLLETELQVYLLLWFVEFLAISNLCSTIGWFVCISIDVTDPWLVGREKQSQLLEAAHKTLNKGYKIDIKMPLKQL